MSGAVWLYVVVGIFVLVVLVLGVPLLVGQLRGRTAQPPATPPETVPHPRGETIPPTGCRQHRALKRYRSNGAFFRNALAPGCGSVPKNPAIAAIALVWWGG